MENSVIKNSTILIVDDNPDNLMVLAGMLENVVKDFAFARSGDEALSLLGSSKIDEFDLILLDIMMTEIDGYEVCRRLKTDKKTRDIPVIFVTAKVLPCDELKGLDVGGVDYVTKPFEEKVLLARVKAHLSLRQAQKEIKRQNNDLMEAAKQQEDTERIMRHDLRSPLCSILGLVEVVLEEEGFSKKVLKMLEHVNKEGWRLNGIIELSLAMARMERGEYSLEPKSVDLLAIIRSISSNEKVTRKGKFLIIEVDNAPTTERQSFFVSGEELLCYTMIANLTKNAIEASPVGMPVTISFSEKSEMAIVKIHNYGVVPEEIRERFFEKYVTSGKRNGTGLGTYSANLIAKTMGGDISLDVSDKKGTTTITDHAEYYRRKYSNYNLIN